MTAPDKAASDKFGRSVSKSGNILAIGAFYADLAGKNSAGAAYLYRHDANGSTNFLSKLIAPDGSQTTSTAINFSVR